MTSILFWLDRAYRKQIQCIEIFHVDIKWFIHPMWLLKFNVFWVFLYNRSPFICKHDRIAYWSLEIDLSELQEYDLVDAKKKKVKHVWIRFILLCFFSRPSSGLWQDLLIKMRLWKFSCLTTTNTCPTGKQALIEALSEGDRWGARGSTYQYMECCPKTPFCAPWQGTLVLSLNVIDWVCMVILSIHTVSIMIPLRPQCFGSNVNSACKLSFMNWFA